MTGSADAAAAAAAADRPAGEVAHKRLLMAFVLLGLTHAPAGPGVTRYTHAQSGLVFDLAEVRDRAGKPELDMTFVERGTVGRFLPTFMRTDEIRVSRDIAAGIVGFLGQAFAAHAQARARGEV